MEITREQLKAAYLARKRYEQRKESWVKEGIALGFLDENGEPDE